MSNVKNFGLTGVAGDVQYGKGGGRVQFDGSNFNITDSGGSTLVELKGASGVSANAYVTKAQLDSTQTGLDIKGASDVVAQPDQGTLGQPNTFYGEEGNTWTTAADGTFTGAATVVDGKTLAQGDRVLVRNSGIDFDSQPPLVSTNEALRNGIYEVTATTSTWIRAVDNNTDALVGYGDYTFVTGGATDIGDSFVTSNSTGIGDNDLTMNTDPVIWVIFSNAPVYTASDGVLLTSSNFTLNTNSVADTGTAASTSIISFGDGAAGTADEKQSLGGVLNALNVVYGIGNYVSGSEFVVRTSEDTYESIQLTGSDVAGMQGIDVGTLATSEIKVGLDIAGLTTATTVIDTNSIVLYDGTDNLNATFTDVVNDLDLVRTNGIASGLLTKTADDVYVGRSIAVNVGDLRGLNVVNADGVTDNPTLGLNILGLPTVAAELTDSFPLLDTTDSSNKRATIQSIIDLVSATISDNEISQGDSSVVITDVGIGQIDITVDGNVTATFVDGLVTVDALEVEDLNLGRVVLGGVNGRLTDDVGLTYAGSSLGVSGTVVATGDISGANATFTGIGSFTGNVSGAAGSFASLGVTGAGTFGGSLSAGAITGASLNVSTGSIDGGIISGTTLNATADVVAVGAVSGISLAAGANGISDSSLTGNGAVVFSDATSRLIDDGAIFSYDTTTNTLTVTNLNVTGNGGISVLENELAFGDASNNVQGSVNFVVDDTAGKLTVSKEIVAGTVAINGDVAQTITGAAIDGDINIVPNGTGEVVIGSAGDGVISSEVGQSIVIDGSVDLTLNSGTGSVFITDNDVNVAQFDANANADTYLVFNSDTVANGVRISTNQAADIKFVLGVGSLVKALDGAAYDTALDSDAGTAFTTKSYVDNAITVGAAEGSTKSFLNVVSLAVNGTTALGTLPAGATVLSVKVNVATVDSTATLEVGLTGTTSRYMTSAENDPQTTGIYQAETFDTDPGTIAVEALVAGSATDVGATSSVFVEYRVPIA